MTERTGWQRPNYRVLSNTGEHVIVDSRNSEESTSQKSEVADTFQDTEHETPTVHVSSSSLTDTSSFVEADGAAPAASLSDSDLSLADTSSDSVLSLISGISTQLSQLSIVETEGQVPHITTEDAQTSTYEYPGDEILNLGDTVNQALGQSTDAGSVSPSSNESLVPTLDGGDCVALNQSEPHTGVDPSNVTPVENVSNPADLAVVPNQFTSHNKMSDQLDQLKAQVESLGEDIDDFLDENPVSNIFSSIPDLDDAIKGVENHRSFYRSKHKELAQACTKEEYDDLYIKEYNLRLEAIKKYILAAKEQRKILRDEEDIARVAEDNAKNRKLKFLVSEVKKAMDRMETVFVQTIAGDDEVIRRKNELADRQKESQGILKSIQEIIVAGESETTITSLRERYEKLLESQEAYINLVHHEFNAREIEKQKTFKKSLLSIKIPKFKGYDSECDVYTFQDEFEKLHLRDTPKDHLPDLLKNNYLLNPAKLLVTDVHEIDDIWLRLKEAYGDHQIMLSKKLSEIDASLKPKGSNAPPKIVEVLWKIVNVMRDLLKLARRHKIENKLYYGDGLNRIYRQLDGNRRRRWLELAGDIAEGEAQWNGLIAFLEKELRVSQQDAIIMAKPFTSKVEPKDTNRRGSSSFHAAGSEYGRHSTSDGESRSDKECYICGAHDHTQTNGPRGLKLVQYFSCKTFSEWQNVERFNYLKSQGYCVQCLYPGADQKSGKHKDGRCQRDFSCKHPSHERFTVKKHILLCDEHKDSEENKETLKKFKERCMGRVKNLPEHARNIQLHHVMSPPKVSPHSVQPSVHKPTYETSLPAAAATTAKCQTATVPTNRVPQGPALVKTPLPSIVNGDEVLSTCDAAAQLDNVLSLSEETSSYSSQVGPSPPLDEALEESAIYMLQVIEINSELYTIFYDSGCKQFVCQHNAVTRLGSRALVEEVGPTSIAGVGGMSLETPHGIYKILLPLSDGSDAVLSGVCLDRITESFPTYPLQGQVEEDIRVAYHRRRGDVRKLPDLPASVGGDTAFMLGIQYNRYFPTEIFRLPSGLSIYKSRFKNPDGSDGVVGGCHRIFTEIENQHNLVASSFITAQLQLFRTGFQVNPDVSLLGYRELDACYEVTKMSHNYEANRLEVEDPLDLFNKSEEAGSEVSYRCSSCNTIFYTPLKAFKEAEEAGSQINYRCVRCRACKDCKNFEHNEALSIKEEVEEDMINRSVVVDMAARETVASLPCMADPKIKLAPNRNKAEKTYQRQLKVLQNPQDKASVIKAEATLQEMGFVDWVHNLPEETQKSLKEHPVQNFIPWRVVWKEGSVSTPCRPVFDASQPTSSGYSLNDIVAKGKNNLNVLLEIFLRWRTHKVGFHNDVQKMYNKVKLKESDWCMQRYLFQENLDPTKPPQEKVIKTLIYGVKSSGNQAQRGLRVTAEMSKSEFPEVNEIVQKDTYMDDIMSGGESVIAVEKWMDELEIVLSRGGFALKGFTISGEDPDPKLSANGMSILVAGHTWFSKGDRFGLNIQELNFARKHRGRKATVIKDVPVDLTPGHCRSKVAEIFDMSGLFTPITAPMKVDLHKFVRRKLQWDHVMPNEFRHMWESHFAMMKDIKNVHFKRAVIPDDALNLEAETLDFGDASQSVVCVAIYIRFKRKGGGHSCQLLFAKSKLVPDGMTQPRGELYAALINTHAGEVVRRSLRKIHRKAIKFTDSQIVLHWICNLEKSLELWIRNRIIEILRFTHPALWRYIRSADMIADIGTRPVASLDVVGEDSDWVNGYEWMRAEESDFPMMSAEEVTIANQENQQVITEVHIVNPDVDLTASSKGSYSDHSEKIAQRYLFSDYIIDPNYRRFDKVVRLVAIWKVYVQKLKRRTLMKSKPPIPPPPDRIVFIILESAIAEARSYFFRKATMEVKKFARSSQYRNISQESDGILLYTGRILPSEGVTIVGKATEVMKDLSSSTFSVPLVDRYSPLAYSISNEIHWYHKTAQHTGRETVWRYVLQSCFIIEGKSLVDAIGKSCERCRYLNKRTLDVIMGAVSGYGLTIAPAFYTCQVDLTGPFLAFSPHNKRATIKIWLVVICCVTTSSVNIKVMEDYTGTAFINAFTRFSCEVGYPKTLLVDEGSQLIKGCETMKLKFWDIKFRLHEEVSVEFEVCPVGGHNFNGKVERKIREVKKSITKTVSLERLALLQWETLAATIANSINNMPLALGSAVKPDTEFIDLLTPNRLKLGRNNERSPVSEMVTTDHNKIIEENQAIFNAWFEVWLSAHVPKLMNQPKWFRSDEDLKKGDVVLFLKKECGIGSNYQFGIVEEVGVGRDGSVRRVKVRYRNHSENVDRLTDRAVRSLVVIRRANEMSVMEEIGEVSRYVENQRKRKTCDMATVGECNDTISTSHSSTVTGHI